MNELGVTPYDQMPPYMLAPNPMFRQQQFQQYNAFQGINTGNPLIDMALPVAGTMISNWAGGTALGFTHTIGGNLHNNLRLQVQTQRHNQMMQQLALGNAPVVMDTIRGMSAQMGVDIMTPEYQSSLHRAGVGLGYLAPWMPEPLADFLTGGRNIAGMGSSIFMAGQNRRDPFTGTIGFNAEGAAAVTRQLFSDFGFDRGPNAWRRNTTGFDARQMGDLYGEMSMRGLLSPETAGPGGKLDTTRIKGQMENYTKALGAVREIFGDAGITNAPMQQLVAALENFTQGANYQLDPNKTNMMLRTMREAANAQGMGMAGAFRMMTAGSRHAEQLGLVPTGVWTMPITTDAINFGLGLNASGALAVPAWGRHTPEQLMAQRQQLNFRNMASPIGNSMGALSRIAAQFSDDPALQAVVKQLRDGIMPVLGTKNFADMTTGEVRAWVAQTTGMDQGQVREIFDQKSTNEQHLHNLGPGAQRVGFTAARREFINKIMGARGGAMHTTAYADMLRTVGNAAGAGEAALAMSEAAGDALRDKANAPLVGDEVMRNKLMGKAIEDRLRSIAGTNPAASQRLQAAEAEARARRISVAEVLAGTGGMMYAAGEQYAINTRLIAPTDRVVNILTATSPDIGAAADEQAARQEFNAMIGAAVAGETASPDFIKRAFEALQKAGHDPTNKATLTEFVKESLNIKDDEEAAATVADIGVRIFQAQQSYDAEFERIRANLQNYTPEQTQEAVDRLEAKRRALSGLYEEYEDLYEKNPALREAVKKAREEREAAGTGDGSEGEVTAATVNIGTLRVTGNGVDFTVNNPQTEVETTGGRRGTGSGSGMPPATNGGTVR